MKDITCHICGNTSITFYKQIRKDGVAVVTARCANGHIPEKGKPFYSVHLFDLKKLPPLNREEHEKQLSFIQSRVEEVKKITKQPYRNFPFPIEEK